MKLRKQRKMQWSKNWDVRMVNNKMRFSIHKNGYERLTMDKLATRNQNKLRLS